MAPHNISLADQLQEMYEKKLEIENKIIINNDLQEFLEEQIDKNAWHLANFPLHYELVSPNSDEYKQLEKKEKKLRHSQENSRYQIEKLKSEHSELKECLEQLDREIREVK